REEMGSRRGGRSAMVGQTLRTPWWEERRSRAQPQATRRDESWWLDPELARSAPLLDERDAEADGDDAEAGGRKQRIFPLGVNRSRLDQAIRSMGLPVEISRTEDHADAVFVLKNMYRKQPDRVDAAQAARVPVFMLRNDSLGQLREALADLFSLEP